MVDVADNAVLIDYEQRSVGIALISADGAVLLAYLAAYVCKQRQLEAVFGGKGTMTGGIVAGNSQHLRVGIVELIEISRERAHFLGATGRVIFRVKGQNDVF